MDTSSIAPNTLLYQELYQANNTSTGNPNSVNSQNTQNGSPFYQILQSIGTNIQSGNMQNANQNLAQLQQTLKGANQTQGQHCRHHRHHAPVNQQANASQPAKNIDVQAVATQTASNVLTTAVSGVSQTQATNATT